MKKIYLHIGMPKTGTTAIQLFLKNNEIALKKHNLVFPQDYMALNTQQEFQFSDGNLCGFFPMLSNEERVARIKKIYENYEQDIILSCERMFVNFATKGTGFFKCLKETCSDINIVIILYLRHQVDFFESLYSERIKYEKEEQSIYDNNQKNFYFKQMEYGKLVSQLSEIFGEENCILQIYEKNAWKNQNLIEDFLSKIGVNSTNEFVFSSNKANFSIDKLTVLLKQHINKILYNMDDIRDTFFIPSLRSTQLHEKMGETKYNKSFFSMEERAQIMKKYEKENAEIAKTYFGKEILFENKYHEKMEEISLNELVSEMIYVFSSAQVEQHIKLKRLEEQINNFHTNSLTVAENKQTEIPNEKERLEETILELSKEKENLTKQIKILQKEKEYAEHEAKQIRESTCWKCTAPLRKITDIIKH